MSSYLVSCAMSTGVARRFAAGLPRRGGSASWTTGHDGSSVVADPLIAVTDGRARASGALARPAAQSPAVGGGGALSGVTVDFYGNPRDATPDRGAVEVGAAGPAIPWE